MTVTQYSAHLLLLVDYPLTCISDWIGLKKAYIIHVLEWGIMTSTLYGCYSETKGRSCISVAL